MHTYINPSRIRRSLAPSDSSREELEPTPGWKQTNSGGVGRKPTPTIMTCRMMNKKLRIP